MRKVTLEVASRDTVNRRFRNALPVRCHPRGLNGAGGVSILENSQLRIEPEDDDSGIEAIREKVRRMRLTEKDVDKAVAWARSRG